MKERWGQLLNAEPVEHKVSDSKITLTYKHTSIRKLHLKQNLHQTMKWRMSKWKLTMTYKRWWMKVWKMKSSKVIICSFVKPVIKRYLKLRNLLAYNMFLKVYSWQFVGSISIETLSRKKNFAHLSIFLKNFKLLSQIKKVCKNRKTMNWQGSWCMLGKAQVSVITTQSHRQIKGHG